MTGNEIRNSFVNFFKEKAHKHYESASLIPDDKTLLLTVAGMVPFKPFFLGEKKAPFKRITTYQKCIRTNDLENVGLTPRHHTFFEMLGNFSFGDYFKKEAIMWSWEYITEVLKLDKDRLYISVYLTDDEAYDIWTKEVGVDPSHMVRLGDEDNWWAAGPIGSCGPCSEIYYDTLNMGKDNCEINSKPGDEGDRFLEIWNLVFTEWNRLEDGTLVPLPEKNIDTGAGIERVASVVQNKKNNFETDLFMPINNKIIEILKLKNEIGSAVKIISDHIRAATFLICDGVLPSNEGRGYILKKLIRRAYGTGALENKEVFNNSLVFLNLLVDSVVDTMKEAYPELVSKADYIKEIIKNEEEKFSKTLKNGAEILFEEIDRMKKSNIDKLSSDISFKLYDTYGFPFEFTKLIAQNNNVIVLEEEFNQKLEEQVKRSQDSRDKVSDMIKDDFIDSFYKANGKTIFTGYETLKDEGKVLHISHIKENIYELITDKTPFYAEGGGQVGDRGIVKNENFEAKIYDTIKKSDIFIHYFTLEKGTIPNINDKVFFFVDEKKRKDTMKNHTATHLLHKALREVLGETVNQAGSLVNEEGLRFDFSYYKAIEKEELLKIENIVNSMILENLKVNIHFEKIDEALNRGAMALFTDKYGDIVRVIDIDDRSVELCGGTHVAYTGQIGLFKIISEQGKASGIRRIEAITGYKSIEYVLSMENKLNSIANKFKTTPANIDEAINKIKDDLKNSEATIKSLNQKLVKYQINDILNEIEVFSNINLLVKEFDDKDVEELKYIVDRVKEKVDNVVILFALKTDKVIFVSGVSKNITDKYNAGSIVKLAANIAGGNGGGRPDFAQAGAKDVNKVKEAITKSIEYIKGI